MNVSFVRRTAEVLLGRLTIIRHLPQSAGHGVVVANGKVGGLKYLLKESEKWDPELLTIARLLVAAGENVWDVGANIGLFSKAAAFRAGAAGSVLSIEADIDAVALLNRTCRHRSPTHADMTVLPVAISDSSGFVRFAIAKRARAANSIVGFGSSQTGGVSEIRTLPCVTLDSLLEYFPRPDVLKIDVEGAELVVLSGAERVLSQSRPVLYCEVTGTTREKVARMLENNGYELWDGFEFDLSMRCRRVSAATTNLVAIPHEKVEKISSRNDLNPARSGTGQ